MKNSDNHNNGINQISKNHTVTIGTLTNRQLKEVKNDDRETDVYYKIDHKLEESNVSIPTYDAVVEAKDWVDDENRK